MGLHGGGGFRGEKADVCSRAAARSPGAAGPARETRHCSRRSMSFRKAEPILSRPAASLSAARTALVRLTVAVCMPRSPLAEPSSEPAKSTRTWAPRSPYPAAVVQRHHLPAQPVAAAREHLQLLLTGLLDHAVPDGAAQFVFDERGALGFQHPSGGSTPASSACSLISRRHSRGWYRWRRRRATAQGRLFPAFRARNVCGRSTLPPPCV